VPVKKGIAMKSARFRTTILGNDKSALGIEIPPDAVASLGTSKRPPVRVTINGKSYRSTVAVMGGKFMVGVSAENRKIVGVAAGDKVEVTLALDTEPRLVTVPPDFDKALGRQSGAKKFFDGLSYSKKQWFVLGIEGAKTAETRERRIAKAVDMLKEGRSP
jgi:Bacteriocin-protection, YdeI or OmpD-Associated/Domain of unknown function (DUF1905)